MRERRATPYVGKVCTEHPELKGTRTAGGHCASCNRERVRKWERDNLDYANAERRRRYAVDPSKRVAVNEKWRKANLSTRAAILARYRARKRAVAVSLTPTERLRIKALYAEAARRTTETGIRHHVDHDKPVALGGEHHPDNLLVVPASINCAKAARCASTWDFIVS